MSTETVEWREDAIGGWQSMEVPHAKDLDATDVAEFIVRELISRDPANWQDFDGNIEIRWPTRIAGLYEVTVEREPVVKASLLEAYDPDERDFADSSDSAV